MKNSVFVLYTICCLLLGSILFQGITMASGYFSNTYYTMQELGCPSGYKACGGVSFKGDITKNDVYIDWKSNQNFIFYIK